MPDRLAEALRLAEAIRMSVSNIKPARNEADRCLRDSAMRVNATEIARLLREEIEARTEPSERERVAVEMMTLLHTCVVCRCDLVPSDAAPHCYDHEPTEEQEEEWIARRALATLAEMEQADGE